MPRRILAFLIASLTASAAAAAVEKPKLVVLIAVDQFRYDYLLRFRGDYKDGFDRLLTRGGVFMESATGATVCPSTFTRGPTRATSISRPSLLSGTARESRKGDSIRPLPQRYRSHAGDTARCRNA